MKKSTKWLAGVGVVAIGGAVLLPQGVYAQAASSAAGTANATTSTSATGGTPPDAPTLGEIVVTAQRRSESINRVPMAVIAVSGTELARRGITSADDLNRVVSGFQSTESYNGAPIYSLRGVGFYNPNSTTTQPVGMYFDESAVPYPYMARGLVYDLERVEVLKGPQGTLYGRNTTGGLVNFIAAKPTDVLSAGVTAEAGNYQTLNVNGYISGPVADWLRVRVAFNSKNSLEGWQQSVTRDDRLGKVMQQAGRFIADIGNGGPFKATLTVNAWLDRSDTMAVQTIAVTPLSARNPNAIASIIPNPTSDMQADWVPVSHQPTPELGIRPAESMDSNFQSYDFKASYDLSDNIKLASLTTYQRLHENQSNDWAGLSVDYNYTINDTHISTFAQELRLIGSGPRLSWSVGGYYAHDTSDVNELSYISENTTIQGLRDLIIGLQDAGTITTPYTDAQLETGMSQFRDAGTIKSQVLSAFGNFDFKFNDKFKLSAGARYTNDRSSVNSCTFDVNGNTSEIISPLYQVILGVPINIKPNQCYTTGANGLPLGDGRIVQSESEGNLAWRGVVDYTPSRDMLFYGSVSRGFKSGSFPIFAASAVTQVFPVKQEQLTAYEAGAKMSLLDRRIQLNMSAFYYDYKNKQIFARVADLVWSALERIVNVPKSYEWGLEGDVTARVYPHVTINAGATYLKSKVTSDLNVIDEALNNTNLRGQGYSYTPSFTANAGVNIDPPISPELKMIGNFSVRVQDRSTASIDNSPLFNINGYAIADASLGVSAINDRWYVAAYAKNLFNKYYWSGVDSAFEIFRFPGMPRQFGVRLGYHF